MPAVVAIFVLLIALETLLTSDRPRWMSRLARFRLAATRRVALADARHPVDDAGYRSPAMEERPPWAGMPELHADGLRIVPDGNGFVVAGTGFRQNRVLRVDAIREGDEVVLSASFVPAPITTLPLLVGFVVLVGARIAEHLTNQTPPRTILFGMLGGAVVGLIAWVRRAHTAAEDAASTAFDAIEAEMAAAVSRERPADARPPASPRWRARLPALAFLALGAVALLARASVERLSQDDGAQVLARQYDIPLEDARRLAPHVLETGNSVMAHPRYPGPERGRKLVLRGVARLGDDDLAARQAILVRLAERSPELCAQMGMGSIDDRTLLATMAREDDATIEAWFAMARRAMHLALDEESGAPLAGDPELIASQVVDSVTETFPEDERAEIERRLFPDPDADDDAWCDSYRVLTEGVERLAPSERAHVLRALATLDAIVAGQPSEVEDDTADDAVP